MREIGEIFGWAGGDDFHFAAVGVFYPAVHAKLGRFAMDEPAKANALNPPADKKVKNHLGVVSVSGGRATMQEPGDSLVLR